MKCFGIPGLVEELQVANALLANQQHDYEAIKRHCREALEETERAKAKAAHYMKELEASNANVTKLSNDLGSALDEKSKLSAEGQEQMALVRKEASLSLITSKWRVAAARAVAACKINAAEGKAQEAAAAQEKALVQVADIKAQLEAAQSKASDLWGKLEVAEKAVKDAEVARRCQHCQQVHEVVERLLEEAGQRAAEGNDTKIRELEQKVADKEARMCKLQQKVTEKKARVRELEQSVQEKDVSVCVLQQRLLEREAVVRELQQQLEGRDGSMRKLEERLREDEDCIKELGQRLDEKDICVLELKTRLHTLWLQAPTFLKVALAFLTGLACQDAFGRYFNGGTVLTASQAFCDRPLRLLQGTL